MDRRISYRNLPQLFLKAREDLLCHFRPIINHFGLTEQQWRILRTLSEREQLEPREICEICHILSPSLAGVLARMDDLGVVIRTRMAEDQRRVLVRLSPKGEAIVAQLAPLIQEQYVLLENALGKDLIQEVYGVVDKLLSAQQRTVIPRVTLPVLDASLERDAPSGQ